MSKKSQAQKDADKFQQQSMKFAMEDRQASRAKADELGRTSKDRLKSFYDLRDKSAKFRNDVESGKDLTSLMGGELALRNQAANRADMENKMFQNTGSRAIMGAPDANFQAQLDTQAATQRSNSFASDTLGLLGKNMDDAKQDMLNAETVINNDQYQIANVLSGNAAQGMGFMQLGNQTKQQMQNQPNFFSKYVMPIAQAGAGVLGSWLTGGATGGGGK